MGKSAGTTKSTSTSSAPGYVDPAYQQQVSEAQKLYAQPGPSYYPGTTVASMNPAETAAQTSATGAAGDIGNFFSGSVAPYLASTLGSAGSYAPQLNTTLSQLGTAISGQPNIYGSDTLSHALSLPNNIGNDPGLAAAISGATAPVWRDLRENVLPGLRSDAIGAGTLGGTKPSIAEGLATSRAAQSAQEIGAQMQNQAYQNSWNTALQAQQQGQAATTANTQQGLQLGQLLGGLDTSSTQAANVAASLAPVLSTGLATPSTLLGAVGGQQRSLDQANIDAAIARYNYEQQLPYQKLQEFANTIKGPFGGTSTSEVTGTADKTAQTIGLVLSAAGVLPGVIQQIIKIFTGG